MGSRRFRARAVIHTQLHKDLITSERERERNGVFKLLQRNFVQGSKGKNQLFKDRSMRKREAASAADIDEFEQTGRTLEHAARARATSECGKPVRGDRVHEEI